MGCDSLGIVNAGLDLVAYSECKSIFRNIHHENFKNCQLIGSNYDSNIIKIPDDEFLKYKDKIKLIFAGFPCQGFSNAKTYKKDVDDPRNTLFREFLRAT
jgi:DNA (cytosine-5)-methyltransferase 1